MISLMRPAAGGESGRRDSFLEIYLTLKMSYNESGKTGMNFPKSDIMKREAVGCTHYSGSGYNIVRNCSKRREDALS